MLQRRNIRTYFKYKNQTFTLILQQTSIFEIISSHGIFFKLQYDFIPMIKKTVISCTNEKKDD